jgi:hypothetical protein
MIVYGAWRSIDGVVRNISGALRSVKLLGVSTFVIEHCHLVIHRF